MPKLCSSGATNFWFHLAVKSARKDFIAGSFHKSHCGDCCADWRNAPKSGTLNTNSVSAGNRLSAGGMAAETKDAANRKMAVPAMKFFKFIYN